jgi:putative redox protein
MTGEQKISRWTSAIIGKDHYRTQLITDTHQIIGDEPVDKGGTDQGPSPGDLIRMSLASCTAITLRMYADRKNYRVDKIEVKVFTETVGKKTVFHTSVHLTGILTDEQRTRMLQIAKLCPVHKMLTNPIETDTVLASAGAVS